MPSSLTSLLYSCLVPRSPPPPPKQNHPTTLTQNQPKTHTPKPTPPPTPNERNENTIKQNVVARGGRVYLKHNAFGDDVPIVAVLKAMGLEADQAVVAAVGQEDAFAALLMPSLQARLLPLPPPLQTHPSSTRARRTSRSPSSVHST